MDIAVPISECFSLQARSVPHKRLVSRVPNPPHGPGHKKGSRRLADCLSSPAPPARVEPGAGCLTGPPPLIEDITRFLDRPCRKRTTVELRWSRSPFYHLALVAIGP